MKEHPSVSIIILMYNGKSYIKDCLNSVVQQDYPKEAYEIIVADNGSTDNSVSLVQTIFEDNIKLVKLERNYGFAKGNNLAVRYAKGDLLIFLNQDTIVHRNWVSALVAGCMEYDYDACHSNMLFPRNSEFHKAFKRDFPNNVYYYDLTKLGYVNQIIKAYQKDIIETKAIAGGSFAIKRNVLDDIGYLFDERFGMYIEDTDLALRLSQKGYKIGVVPSSVVYHFTHFSFKFSRYNLWKNMIMIRNRMTAFWKYLTLRDFIFFLPKLFLSQSHKIYKRSIEIKNGRFKSVQLAICVMPLCVIGFVRFILSIYQNKKES